jgi:hypothetical protein
MKVTYIEYFMPGAIVSENYTKIIEPYMRNHPENLVVPDGVYGFRFFDREEIEQDGEILRGPSKNQSGMYYIGTIHDYMEVLTWDPKEYGTLESNMRINEWEKVVKTKYGQFFPLEKDDRVLA